MAAHADPWIPDLYGVYKVCSHGKGLYECPRPFGKQNLPKPIPIRNALNGNTAYFAALDLVIDLAIGFIK